MDKAPQEQGFISFPPFYAGDYEGMFKNLEKLFLWKKPEYQIFNEERLGQLVRKTTSKAYWLFGTRFNLPDLSRHLVGKVRTTNRGVTFYVYSSHNEKVLVMPNQETEQCMIPRLQCDEDIGDVMSIRILTSGEFSSLRSQYMNRNIKPGMPTIILGVLVDNKLIGCFAFSMAPTQANWNSHIIGPHAYLLSDFPVSPSKYKRLAKLVLYAALSKESKLIAERSANKRQNSVVTTAFSMNPESMKYRGLFDKLNCAEEEGDYYRYKMNYGSLLGRWTLLEGLNEWKAKHSKAIG